MSPLNYDAFCSLFRWRLLAACAKARACSRMPRLPRLEKARGRPQTRDALELHPGALAIFLNFPTILSGR